MRKIHSTYNEEEAGNPFALSIGDLMAALLLIFILLLTSTLLRLQDEFENKTQIAEQYKAIKEIIYNELQNEFSKEIEDGKLTIHKENLMIRFSPKLKFESNDYKLDQEFRITLSNFFPRYINIISKEEFKENIEEIRIEGHTDNQAGYIYNMQLSQARTRTVLEYVLDSTSYDSLQRGWLMENLTANGLSYSKPISDNLTEDGRRLNRRVEFKIRTNAESQLEEILKINLNE